MKKFLPLLILSFCQTLPAATFVAGGNGNEVDDNRNYKFSSAKWYSDRYMETSPLPKTVSPGPRDGVYANWNHVTLELDKSVKLEALGVDGSSTIFARGKRLEIKRISMGPQEENGTATLDLENCVLEVKKGITCEVWTKQRSIGTDLIKFTDTKAHFGGGITFISSVGEFAHNSTTGGVILHAKGASQVSFDGDVLLDELFAQDPATYMFSFIFEDNNGKLPSVSFRRKANFQACRLEFRISSLPEKAGRYVLLNLRDRKATTAKAREIIVNEVPYKLGDEVQTQGGGKFKIEMDCAEKDGPKNDIVLEVIK